MKIVIVRTCTTPSLGTVTVEIPGGTEDKGPYDLPDAEALELIAEGHARIPPPHLADVPAVNPKES